MRKSRQGRARRGKIARRNGKAQPSPTEVEVIEASLLDVNYTSCYAPRAHKPQAKAGARERALPHLAADVCIIYTTGKVKTAAGCEGAGNGCGDSGANQRGTKRANENTLKLETKDVNTESEPRKEARVRQQLD